MPHYPTLDSKLSFSDYIAACQAMIKARRHDLNHFHPVTAEEVIEANSPFELYPKNASRTTGKIKHGVLLIHGLFDCPFSMREIAESLNAKGALCRAILLPGHGTTPQDLLQVTLKDWVNAVKYGIESLANEVEQIYLVGYSTGAALSILEAIHDSRIEGIVLLAPAIRIKRPIDMLASWRRFVKMLTSRKTWAYRKDELNYTKYRSIPVHPVAQLHRLSELVRELGPKHTMHARMMMILSSTDETVSIEAALHFFELYVAKENKIICYGDIRKKPAENIIIRNEHYPHLHVENFSHICLPFSENNRHYGKNGDYIHASHQHTKEFIYGGYNRIQARVSELLFELGLNKRKCRELTYNPDFKFMADEITHFIFGQ